MLFPAKRTVFYDNMRLLRSYFRRRPVPLPDTVILMRNSVYKKGLDSANPAFCHSHQNHSSGGFPRVINGRFLYGAA